MTVDLAFPPTEATPFISLPRAVARFGKDAQGRPLMERRRLQAIALSGALDAMTGTTAVQIGTTGCVVVSEAGIEALHNAPEVDLSVPHERIVNLRVNPAKLATDAGRHYMGWHAAMTDEEARLGVTRWWPPPKDDVRGLRCIATVRGLIVYVGRIRSVHYHRGMVGFDLDTNDQALTGSLLFHRVPTQRGGTFAYI